jgi:hypothetical protein
VRRNLDRGESTRSPPVPAYAAELGIADFADIAEFTTRSRAASTASSPAMTATG